jgi:hypothetical protein
MVAVERFEKRDTWPNYKGDQVAEIEFGTMYF